MNVKHSFTPAQVHDAKIHMQTLYKNARGEYYSKLNINPHPPADNSNDGDTGAALLWLNLKQFTGQAEVADWVMWSVGFGEAHADIWGPPIASLKGEN